MRSTTPQLDPDHSRKPSLYRLACYLVTGWLVVLFFAAFIAFTLKWLDPARELTPLAPAIADNTTNGDDDADVTNSDDTLPDDLPPLPDDPRYQPRSVQQMIDESLANDEANALANNSPNNANPHDIEDVMLNDEQNDVSDELATLLKEARYAQIEGDIKRSIIKLEQASEIAPDNPIVAYYFGLSYEFLRNAPKAREHFAKVVAKRNQAGKYYDLAALHLERGFSSPSDRRGDISFGPILVFHDPTSTGGERVLLTIPILMKDGLNIRPEDLYIPIQFFDAINGNKSVDLTRAQEPSHRWVTKPVDWAEGEEILEVEYFMPALTDEELIAYGDLKYYGYTAKLYYKGEPMDCQASPPALFLIEQHNQNNSGFPGLFESNSLLPPLDAEPMSDTPEFDHQPTDDDGLLPL